MLFVFLFGLLFVIYMIIGFDVFVYMLEEMYDVVRNVLCGIIGLVFWFVIFGYVMVCVFVLVMFDLIVSMK